MNLRSVVAAARTTTVARAGRAATEELRAATLRPATREPSVTAFMFARAAILIACGELWRRCRLSDHATVAHEGRATGREKHEKNSRPFSKKIYCRSPRMCMYPCFGLLGTTPLSVRPRVTAPDFPAGRLRGSSTRVCPRWHDMSTAVPPGVHSIWVINKSGGLVYQKSYADVPAIDTNETLRLASIWHSLHAISAQLSPVEGCLGIELLETQNFDLRCVQTVTGTKFFVTASPKTPGLANLLHAVYDLYCDYVMKNPFYELEMPIRCELFEQNVQYAVRATNNAFGY